MTDELKKDILQTLKNLEDIRRPYEPMIDEILTYIYHGRRVISDKDRSTHGNKTGIKVYDDTAMSAVNLLTDGLTGYTISRSFKWFGHSLPQQIKVGGLNRRLDSIPEVKAWLDEGEEAMYAAYQASNVYDMSSEFVRDAATIGTVTIDADEDIANRRCIFSVPHFRECFIAENYFGMVDTIFRVRKLTLKQLVEKFGLEQMKQADPGFLQAYENNRHDEREVVHARYPRADYDPAKKNGKNKQFASVWILRSPEKLLLESGTDFQSSVTWRWRKNSDEWYGRSPAWDCYVSAMTANQMRKTNMKAAHKMVEPPMVGPSDLRGKVQRGPNGWTSLDDMGRIPRPLVENIQLPFGIDALEKTQQAIRDNFHVDFFMMLSQAAMQKVELTATQVIEMGGEKAAVLGPRIGRMETEALGPIHDILWNMERRAGRIPDPPDILLEYQKDPIKVEYLGPLAQAQKKLFMSQGIQQGLDAVVGIAQMFPESLDMINPDEAVREILQSRGFPQKAMNNDDKVKEIRNMRNQAREEQQALQDGVAVARSMPAAGKEISPDSAAGMLLGMGGGA